MIKIKNTISALQEACNDFPVDAAYVHGSYAAGREDKESDLDIALLADASLNKRERQNLRIDVMQRLAEKFGHNCTDFDVVVLQDVPVLLRYNVKINGMRVFERNPSARIAFEISAEREYEDEKPYLDRELTITVNKILALA